MFDVILDQIAVFFLLIIETLALIKKQLRCGLCNGEKCFIHHESNLNDDSPNLCWACKYINLKIAERRENKTATEVRKYHWTVTDWEQYIVSDLCVCVWVHGFDLMTTMQETNQKFTDYRSVRIHESELTQQN